MNETILFITFADVEIRQKNGVGVQWLKSIDEDDLYAWDGTSHVIHVETLLEVNPDLFHRSSRVISAKKKKNNNKKRDLFCLIGAMSRTV